MRIKKLSKGSLPRKNQTKVRQWGWLLKFLWWIVGIFVAYYLGTVGPIWPTEPEIRPNGVSANNPFDIPFSITNKSVLFDIKKPVFDCWATYIRMSREKYILDSVARARGRTIPAGTLVTGEL